MSTSSAFSSTSTRARSPKSSRTLPKPSNRPERTLAAIASRKDGECDIRRAAPALPSASAGIGGPFANNPWALWTVTRLLLGKMHAQEDILIVIAEPFAEDVDPTGVLCAVTNADAQPDRMMLGQLELVQIDLRDLRLVDE